MSFRRLILLFSILLATFCQKFVNGTTTVTPLRTTTTPTLALPQCGGCVPLVPRRSYSSNSLPSISSNKSDAAGCTQIITCNATINSYGYVSLTIMDPYFNTLKKLEDRNSTEIEAICKNGRWYSTDNKEIHNSYDCQYISPTTVTRTWTTPMQFFTRAKTSWISYTTTSTPRTTTTTTEPPRESFALLECNYKGPLFQRFTVSGNPVSKQWGKFAGYFESRTGCQRLCNKNYKEKCYGYMYEPNNHGTCTIFEKALWITENPNSKHIIYKKCERMPPAVSAKCCGQLIQRHSTSGNSDGIMTFVYNDETCRSTASVTCSQPQKQGLELVAGIVVNEIHFLEIGPKSITLPATCYNGVWQIAQPPLNVTRLECIVSDPV
jgi:hypothetical protein